MMIRNVNAANQHIRIMKKISFAITGMVYILKIYIFCKLFEIVIIIHCFYVCVMCIYSINTRFDAILKSSYLQKSSLCKRVLGKSFVLFHAERFSTEAERKHVRVKEAERRDETSCL